MDYERKRAFAALPDQGAVPRYEAVYAYNQRKRGPYLYDRNDRLPENYEGARGNLIPRPYTAQDGTELFIIQVGIPVQLLERCGVDHPTLSLTQIQPLTIFRDLITGYPKSWRSRRSSLSGDWHRALVLYHH